MSKTPSRETRAEATATPGDAPRREATAALAEGRPRAVVELWRGVAGASLPDDERWAWVLLLVEAGVTEEAARAARDLSRDELQARAARLLDGEDDAREDDDEIDVEALVEAPPAADAEVRRRFLEWFGGRRDLYARQWYDRKRRRAGYRVVREPLTDDVARAHLDGRLTVGQYLLHRDETCSFGVVDLDLTANAFEALRAGEGEEVSPLRHDGLRRHALALLDAGRRLGIPLFAEDSGGRGAHLWLFLRPRRPARAVRAVLGQIALAAGSQPPDVGVEIFPKQDRLGPRGLSSLVKLPLGLHQATLRRCALLDDDLAPIEDDAAALERLRAAPPDAFGDVAGRRVMALPTADRVEAAPALPATTSARSLARAMRDIVPGRPEQEACERMLAGCGVLRRLVEGAYAARRLEPAHARALLYTIGLVGPECRLIEELFATAGVSRRELERVRRGLPAPTGCGRLRRLEVAGATECPCPVAESAVPYATPALLAVGAREPAAPRWAPFAAALDVDPAEAADPLVVICERLRVIEERLTELTAPAAREGERASRAGSRGRRRGGSAPEGA